MNKLNKISERGTTLTNSFHNIKMIPIIVHQLLQQALEDKYKFSIKL